MIKKFFSTIKNFVNFNSDTNRTHPQEIISGFMSLTEYNITGINEKTGHRKHFIIQALNESSAINIATSKGLIPPYQVKINELAPPTERQLNYAKSIALKLPQGCCIHDVSALLTNYENNDINRPSTRLIEFAKSKQIYFSTLYNEKSLYNILFSDLLLEDKIAFFLFFCLSRLY